MKERPPKFVREVRRDKGEEAFLEMSRKGGLISGGKRSEQAAADAYYKNKRRKEDEIIQSETHKNTRITKEGDVLPPGDLAA